MDIHLHLISNDVYIMHVFFFDGWSLLNLYQRTVTVLHLPHILVSHLNKIIFFILGISTFFFQGKKTPLWFSLITARVCWGYVSQTPLICVLLPSFELQNLWYSIKYFAYLIAGYASSEEPTGGGMFHYDVGEINVKAEMEESYQNTDK